jgi:Phage XkdN-like protein.
MSKMTDEEILKMKEEDILTKLMGTYEVPTATVFIERMGIPVTLKGLSEKEISKIRKDCTYSRKARGGKIEEKFDGNEFDAGLIVAATANFDWNNTKLIDSAKSSDGKQFIRKKLLAGEISSLTDKILELSGFNDELEEVEDIKNL